MTSTQTKTPPPAKSDGPRKLSPIVRHAMRFYDADDKAIVALRKSISHVSDDTFTDIVRKAVNAGLPIVIEQWKPIINEKE
jgi:hypothetical protein